MARKPWKMTPARRAYYDSKKKGVGKYGVGTGGTYTRHVGGLGGASDLEKIKVDKKAWTKADRAFNKKVAAAMPKPSAKVTKQMKRHGYYKIKTGGKTMNMPYAQPDSSWIPSKKSRRRSQMTPRYRATVKAVKSMQKRMAGGR
jgi:hypothetical protein